MAGKLFIHATNVHHGGGRALLCALLDKLPDNLTVNLSVDSRLILAATLPDQVKLRRVRPSIRERFEAERWLAASAGADDIVLCFGNLPPLFKTQGRIVLFLQNRYLIDGVALGGHALKVKIRLAVERLWLSRRIHQVNEVIVQTRSMKYLAESQVGAGAIVSQLAFTASGLDLEHVVSTESNATATDIKYLYVASGDPHKNHRNLLKAWCLLAEEQLYPSLELTVDTAQFRALSNWIESKKQTYGLRIENLGKLASEDVEPLYRNATALIYPSVLESFGLPLLEARQVGLPILAAELDYVRDLLDPEQTFDPHSALSIARAVKRHMGQTESRVPVQGASDFLYHVLFSAPLS